ncbi:hypothetical protein [Gordonia sp. N1V]|uniref:hypothetical protein n=1 Tax=Gordonia sp. N1V TaxID=3034163 RepID=UPI0023E0E191|nr:hypothetical protein [Gordonia sp. N1V]MDF3281613.1 hypothetical protein [Gordonia sp. N1V]
MSSKSSDTTPLLVGAVLVIGAVIWFVIHFWYVVVGLIAAGALVFVVIKLVQRNAARREHLEAEKSAMLARCEEENKRYDADPERYLSALHPDSTMGTQN